MELIKVTHTGGRETVNARDLHDFLGVQTQYRDWIKNRIEKYGFIENLDFIAIAEKKATAQGNISEFKTHYLTIDMAKELSMVENNDKGRMARRYFINLEKQFINLSKSKEARKDLTDSWHYQGVKEPWQYGKLTKIEYQALGFGPDAKKKEMSNTQKGLLLIADTWESIKLQNVSNLGYNGCAMSIMQTSLEVRNQAKRIGLEN